MEAWDAPAEIIEQWQQTDKKTEFGVWPEHWDVVQAFKCVTSQWRVAASMDGLLYLGFDYAGVRAGLKAAKIKLDPDQWRSLQLMESAALKALNERQ